MMTTRPSRVATWARTSKSFGLGTALTIVALFIATPASADETSAYNAGVAAFEAGEFAAAYAAWLPLAQSGDVDAQRNLGLLHQTGRGVTLDLGAAFYWYRLAAEAGNAPAANSVAMMYLAGDGLPSDYVAAGAWLTRAAAQGYGPAQLNLGLLYERGIGVEQDDRTALGWFVLAAENGQSTAVARITQIRNRLADARAPAPTRESRMAVQLSWAIVRGLTGVGNDVEVAALTQAAALDGLAASPGAAPGPPALPTLGVLTPPVPAILLAEAAEALTGFNRIAAADRLVRGRAAFERGDGGVAMTALLPAAIAGDAESQFLVGRMYEAGMGVPADPAEAVAWLALAAIQGHVGAVAAVEATGARLDPEQFERATRLVAARTSARRPTGVP